MSRPESVSTHYTVPGLGDRILAQLASAGHDLDALTIADLAGVDAFHIRGRAATEELAAWAEIQPGSTVLDVGSGIGGTSRYLAATTGCSVVGVDLTAEFCRVAEMLSARVGLSDRTSFREGDATALPVDDGAFDVVWTEHAQMNIADKPRFYGELARALRPGGRLAFHDIFAGPGGGLHFPVPWAGDASISHLVTVGGLRKLLDNAGFEVVRWEDKTAASLAFFDATLERLQAEGPRPVGLHLIMGVDALDKFKNLHRNLQEGHVQVIQAVLTR